MFLEFDVFSFLQEYFWYIFFGILAINLIVLLVKFVKNRQTSYSYSDFEHKLRCLRRGMNMEEVIRTLGKYPDERYSDELRYNKKMQGYGSYTDHETTHYVLYFDREGRFLDYSQGSSYRRTRTVHY